MSYIHKNIQFRLLSIRQKFPGFDSRLNQIQGVDLKLKKIKKYIYIYI